jgi:hypothetical protein
VIASATKSQRRSTWLIAAASRPARTPAAASAALYNPYAAGRSDGLVTSAIIAWLGGS